MADSKENSPTKTAGAEAPAFTDKEEKVLKVHTPYSSPLTTHTDACIGRLVLPQVRPARDRPPKAPAGRRLQHAQDYRQHLGRDQEEIGSYDSRC